MFDTANVLGNALTAQDYIAERGLTTAIYLALKLNKPLFLEGEAGVGKTEVAIARAKAPEVEPMLAKQITAFVQEMRRMELFKAPGIAETLDWTAAVIALDQQALSLAGLCT